MHAPPDFPIFDDEMEHAAGADGVGEPDAAEDPGDDEAARDRRRRSLRTRREVLRRTDLRRARTYGWVGCLALLGAAVKLASLAWRGWRAGNGATAAVFGGLFVAAVLGAVLLARRARAAGAILNPN